MSEISDLIRGSIMLADYAVTDAVGKVNVIGGGLSVIGFDLNQGITTPFTVYASLTCPIPAPDSSAAVEVALVDASGNPVAVAGPTGEGQVVRIAQNVEFAAPVIPGLQIPRGAIESASQIIVNFGNGIPLGVGQAYAFRLSVDGDVKASAAFFVPGPIAGPVIG